MTTIRKTPKYFREILTKSFDEAVVTDIVNRYGGKNKTILIDTAFHWNHRIDRVFIASAKHKGKLCLGIYWQGDSTDGNDSILAEDMCRRSEYVIPAVHYFDGSRTRETHSDIRISREELREVADALIRWLSPEGFAKRKKEQERCALFKRVYACLDTLTREFVKTRWDYDERYYNARAAIEKCTDAHCDDLIGRNDEQLAATVRKVFLANRKNDSSFSRNSYGKIFDLSIE